MLVNGSGGDGGGDSLNGPADPAFLQLAHVYRLAISRVVYLGRVARVLEQAAETDQRERARVLAECGNLLSAMLWAQAYAVGALERVLDVGEDGVLLFLGDCCQL